LLHLSWAATFILGLAICCDFSAHESSFFCQRRALLPKNHSLTKKGARANRSPRKKSQPDKKKDAVTVSAARDA
jgi:hypothetical protein